MSTRRRRLNRQQRHAELRKQNEAMRRCYPEFRSEIRWDTSRRNFMSLIVCGTLHPTPISKKYTVRIEYDGVKRPRVLILRPELETRAEGESIPHIWGPNEPCLYYDEWSVGMPIAESIVPWTMLWLVFYESWHVTGEWQGGGKEHGRRRKTSDE